MGLYLAILVNLQSHSNLERLVFLATLVPSSSVTFICKKPKGLSYRLDQNSLYLILISISWGTLN